MNADLKQEITSTFNELIRVFGSFDDNSINVVPFEKSWTAGQTADHIRTFLGKPLEFLQLHVEPVSRPFNEKAAGLRELFLNFTLQFNAPDFTLPSDPPHDKATLLQAFRVAEKQLLEAVDTLDLTMLCKSFELPQIGYLTRYEWIDFFVVHIQRHIHQLRNIQKALLKRA